MADSSGGLVEEPPVWPVILWVAFQVRCHSSSSGIDALITIIESQADEHSGLWSWDHTDDQMLRSSLLSWHCASGWIDHYPSSWREYILSLGSRDWVRLVGLTRRSTRKRLAPSEDDTAIQLSAILALDRFVPGDPNYRQFLSGLLERPQNHHDRDRSPELIHWDDPRAWLEHNRRMLQLSVVDEYRNVPLVHVVGNAYMLHQMPHALPQCLISSVFAHHLKKFGDDQSAQAFRAQVNIWKGWDVTTCLVNFHRILSSVLVFSKLAKDEDIQNATSALMHTDILCICAQFASIFFDPKANQNICKAPNDHTQKLLDLLQDLLDYRLLDPLIHSVLLKGLLKLSKKLKRYPRCFALRHLRLAGNPVAAGTFGDIWKTQFHKEIVCVKVMRVYEESDIEALLKEFHHEALIWRQLAHSNVLPFFGVYFTQEERPRLCLVSPWMENGNISSYLKRHPAGCNRLTLVLDVALGLEYLHGRNLVHGDLKGLNVLVTRSGRAVLADFGLSSVVTESKIVVFFRINCQDGRDNEMVGPRTLPWRSNQPSVRRDPQIFTGTIPFSELPEAAVMLRVIKGDRPKQHPSISASVWNLILECWGTEPNDRPSAVHVVSRLRDCSIGAVQNDAALDWDRWYTAKFRSSLQEHTLFKIDYSPRVPASLQAPASESGRIGPIRPVETPVTPSPSPASVSPTPPPAAPNTPTQPPKGPIPGPSAGAQRGPAGQQAQHPNLVAALDVTTPQCFRQRRPRAHLLVPPD
ncbi:kinase-like domain-containing protein [Mycena sanguinolenta]|nr:kinase-like domain-containing protein [Mycena sanguinolenta]